MQLNTIDFCGTNLTKPAIVKNWEFNKEVPERNSTSWVFFLEKREVLLGIFKVTGFIKFYEEFYQ